MTLRRSSPRSFSVFRRAQHFRSRTLQAVQFQKNLLTFLTLNAGAHFRPTHGVPTFPAAPRSYQSSATARSLQSGARAHLAACIDAHNRGSHEFGHECVHVYFHTHSRRATSSCCTRELRSGGFSSAAVRPLLPDRFGARVCVMFRKSLAKYKQRKRRFWRSVGLDVLRLCTRCLM